MKIRSVVLISLVASLSGCTVSFQNISTHGTATDLVDENQSPQTDLKTVLRGVPL
jgi:hypothetical protein